MEPPAALLELVVPGHEALLASGHFANADALQWLLVVWLQDAPLKVEAEGEAWSQHFPQLMAIAAHPEWPRFREAVLQRHAESLSALQTPSHPCTVTSTTSLLQEQLKAQAATFQQQLAAQAAAFQAQLAAHAALQDAHTQRIFDLISKTLPPEAPTAAAATRSLQAEESAPELKRQCIEADFKVGNFYTVKEAYGAFLRVSSIPHGQRGRRGGSKNTHSMALSKFRLGLARQVELRGFEALDQERREDPRFKPAGGKSSLQIQVAYYYKQRDPF